MLFRVGVVVKGKRSRLREHAPKEPSLRCREMTTGAPRVEAEAIDRRLRRLYALEGAVFSTFLPFFVLWLRDRGFSPSEIGVILSSSALVGVIGAPVWSSVADRRAGTVRTLQLAFVSAAVLAIALALTGSAFLAVVGVAAALAVAQAPPTPLTDALAMRTLGPDRLHGYGSFRLWASFGWGVGSIAFGALFQAAGLGLMLPVYAVGAVGCGRVRRAVPARAAIGALRRHVAVRRGGGSALDGASVPAVPARRLRVRRVHARLVGLRPAADPGGRGRSVPGRGRGGRERVRRDPVHALERLADKALRDAGRVRRRRGRVRRGLARGGRS